jgi:Bacterial lectin/Bacterial Ig-like domain (group 3)/Cep192 domain 4
MTSRSKQSLLFAAFVTAALLAFLTPGAAAQQVTYYNFDTPATTLPLQYSYSCSTLRPSSNPLFCFNYSGSDTDPSFLMDPVVNDHWTTQLTYPAVSQAASMWFSVPQVVSGGFNTWFEFKITPSSASGNTADGLAFVIQNAQGASEGNNNGVDPNTGCAESGSGPTALGGGGGCMGYSGIDNSLALEFDTFYNSPWDPYQGTGGSTYNDNHISFQGCGPGAPNSSAHLASDSGPGCEIQLVGAAGGPPIPTLITNPETSAAPPANPVPVALADGNVHQVVIVYNGPNDTPANYLYVYLDPLFNPGTVTPVDGSVPLFSGPYDITQAMTLLNSGSANDSAYVGFTSATGAAFEQHELLAWTFTPHTPVTQTQPLQPAGSPNYQPFPFGTHTYGVQYPPTSSGGPSTTGISMTVTASTISPDLFTSLINGTPFQGSSCQVYDDTGGNCVIYSVSCSVTATGAPVVCPAVTSVTDCNGDNAAQCINVKTTYNSSSTPASPGFIQGDPFFTQIASITESSGTATVTCTGECSVTAGQTVTIFGAQPGTLDGSVTVATASPSTPNVFTFATSANTNSTTGGYLTSTNVKNIFTSWNAANIDGTTKGTTLNFSDFVFTSVTNNATTGIQLGAATNAPTVGQPDLLSATVSGDPGQSAAPTGNVLFYAGAALVCTSPVSTTAGVTTATCSYTPTAPGPVTITAQYLGDTLHLPINANPLILTAPSPETLDISPNPIDFGTVYLATLHTKIVTIANQGTSAVTIKDPLIAIVRGGNSKEFVTVNLCPKSLAAGKSCYMTVTFVAGPYYTPQTATLTINDNAYGGPHTIPLTATVIDPLAKFSAARVSFGKVKTNSATATQTITVTSNGATDLSFNGVAIAGANPGDFSATSNCPSSIAPKGTCSISVTFSPTVKSLRTAILTVNDNAFNSPQAILLTGTGN